ncbi:Helicase associated domain protein [Streptomyces mexicanus]
MRILSSVKVLGEGVDTARCDAVAFCDARGSMVDIVQMVGRALRMKPGEGKLASLVVPVFLGPGEDGEEMLTSEAYGTLAKVLGALRAHDTDTIEALADPRRRSGRREGAEDGEGGGEGEPEDRDEDQEDEDAEAWVSERAAGLLRFSEPRDPAVLAQFVRLRVIDPENAYWRRGIAAATRWLRETGADQLRVPYDCVVQREASDEGAGAGFPLGVWLADQRRYYNAGTLDAERVAELEALGMVWSHHDVAFEEGLTVARAWAAEHGHFLPPATAVGEGGFPIGVWAKNQRAAARKALLNAERRAAGENVPVAAGEMSESRLEALEAIDPGWCPLGWDVAWQRCFHLARAHVEAGGTLPTAGGELIVQGEDLGAWTAAQRTGWDKLKPAQQWLLETTLGLEPAPAEEVPARPSRDDKWRLNITAARQFHAREGHLRPARKHVEVVDGTPVKLGSFWTTPAAAPTNSPSAAGRPRRPRHALVEHEAQTERRPGTRGRVPGRCVSADEQRSQDGSVQGAGVSGDRVAAGGEAVFKGLADLFAQQRQDVGGLGVGQVGRGNFEHQLTDCVGAGVEVGGGSAQRGHGGGGRRVSGWWRLCGAGVADGLADNGAHGGRIDRLQAAVGEGGEAAGDQL